VIVLRLAIAALSALIFADCGGMHACTSDGVPCGEQAVRPAASARSSGGSQTPALLPTASASVASAPFVPPAAFEAPAPAAEAPPAPTATVTETTVAAVEEPDEDSGRHHGRHGRHGSRRHRSSGSHSRHHRHH
jgi:hypothetical protein